MGHGHGGTKESNLVTETSMSVNDFVRIITSGSRKITLSDFASSIEQPLIDLGFVNNVQSVRIRDINNISSNYGLLLTDDVILVDSTSSDVTINLMLASTAYDATNNQGNSFTIKKIDSSAFNVILNTAGSDLIDGEPSLELQGIDRPYVHFVSDGSNWWTI
jgi:hypothetical protein